MNFHGEFQRKTFLLFFWTLDKRFNWRFVVFSLNFLNLKFFFFLRNEKLHQSFDCFTLIVANQVAKENGYV